MATEDQLLAGLKAADAAGNTADAQHFVDQIKALRSSAPTGRAPTAMQTLAASPIGSLAHDVVVAPLEGAVNMLHPVDFSFAEKPYQDALAAQKNRPGYAEAQQTAQGVAAQRPTGLTDQFTTPLNPAMAGIAGLLTGGLNGMTASADVQRQGQQDYQQANPAKSGIAQVLGGLMATPAGGPATLPAATSGPGKVLERWGGNPTMPGITPQDEAMNYVRGLMDSSKMDVAGLRSAGRAAGGKPITSAEAIGKPGEVAIGALARREGQTADALGGEMAARQAEAPARILDDFASASGIDPALARGDIEAYVSGARKTVKPMFDQALLSSDKGVWNADLEKLANRPVVQRAMKNVVEDLRNADIDPTGLGFTAQDPATGRFIQQPRPTAQAWDLVKKRLGQSVERDPFGKKIPDSISPGNYNINGASQALTSKLRDAIPGYGDALDASGDYLSMQQAFTDGQSFILNPKVTASQVQQHIAGLSSSEAQAFKGGVANKLFDLQQNGRLAAKLADAPSIQQKLSLALGSDNAAKFLGNLNIEKRMAGFARSRAPGAGSPTAEYTAAMGAQDAGSGIHPEIIDFAANTARHGPISAAVNYGVGKAKDAASAWATRGMSIPVRDASGKLLLMPPNDLASLLASNAAPLAARPAALSAPAITGASRIPYGLAASLASILSAQPASAQTQKQRELAAILAKGN